ncbi:MAG: hypothetical protein ACOC5R_01520 [Elusimicrobiota bacterium]
MQNNNKIHSSFRHTKYLFRRKVFKIFGGAFHVYDEMDNLVFYSKQKAFKLKEDIRIYSDENMTQELLVLKTPQVFDVWATYNIFDPISEEEVGSIKRQFISSLFRDKWIFFSKDGQEIGTLTEKSLAKALLCRYIKLIPQEYCITSSQGMEIARIKRHFNPFVLKFSMDINSGTSSIDQRLLVSAGILLAAIERREK